MASSSSDSQKIPKLHNSKGFALWRLYVTELMRRDGVLRVLTEAVPDPETATARQTSEWKKDDQKARPYIVLNLAEEPATLVTSLLISDALIKEVWYQLCKTYQRENIQSQLNLRTKLHNLQLTETGDIQANLTALEEIFVDLAHINDQVAESDKTGILLRSLPKSLSFVAVVVQAKNMSYIDLCALLKSEDERRKSIKPVADIPPPVPRPAARRAEADEQTPESDRADRNHVTCWYCGKRGHLQGECHLRRRHEQDRPFKGNRGRGRARGRGGHNNQHDQHGNRYNYNRNNNSDNYGHHGNNNQPNQHQPRGFLTKLSLAELR